MPNATIDINNGEVLLPNEGLEIDGSTPTIDDVTQEQIDEIESGYAIGSYQATFQEGNNSG